MATATKTKSKSSRQRRSIGDFCRRVLLRDAKVLQAVYGVTKAALAESPGGPVGGYLVPQEQRNELMEPLEQASIFRSGGALVVPMKTAECLLPLPDYVTVSGTTGVSGLTAGIQFAFTPEAALRTETEPKYRELALKASELQGYATVSNPILQDGNAGAFEALFRRLLAESISWFEDWYFINGTGVGQPLGVVNSPCSVLTTRTQAGQFKQQDAAAMISSLLPRSWKRAVWLLSPSVLGSIASTNNWQTFTAPAPPESGAAMLLMGRPAFCAEQCATLGTKGDALLVDRSLYVVGDRSLDIDRSEHSATAFLKNQSVIRIVDRFDGQPWLNGKVTLQDGFTVASPFVVLV